MHQVPSIPDPPPFVQIMRNLGFEPDPWQVEVLQAGHRRLLLNCCRQAGKSTVVALLGLVEALWTPLSKVLLVSRSMRQARELFRIVTLFFDLLGEPRKDKRNSQELQLKNLSRIICLPCREDTIRGYGRVTLLVLDEAARVPDDLYRAVRPMLAVSGGRMICLSTPHGKRGFFWDAWARGGDDWARIEIPASRCPRIPKEFLEQERRALGESWFRQEYCCSFEALEGLVYPDFARCLVKELPKHVPDLRGPDPKDIGRPLTEEERIAAARRQRYQDPVPAVPPVTKVGGLDFGFRNPFAAIWGLLDRDDVLWLTGEHYARQKPLSYHAQRLPKDVMWYADPAGASDIAELRVADFKIRRGNNDVRSGIMAVSARIEDGTLKVLEGRCPNLLAEAGLYRYGDTAADQTGETPIDSHNHALGALRYLISRLDARKVERALRGSERDKCGATSGSAARSWEQRVDDDTLWDS
jgi:hypothetical protein